MKAGLWLLQLAMACVAVASADQEEDLLSKDWILKQIDGDIQASIRLPGSSLEALEAGGSVQDSLYRWCLRGESSRLYGQRLVTDTSGRCLQGQRASQSLGVREQLDFPEIICSI